MATESIGRSIAEVSFGLVYLAVGTGLATNFKKLTERYARTSIRATRRMGRVPPWRWMPRSDEEARVARQVLLTRFIGLVFTCVGAVVVVLGCVRLVERI